ncbi:hypothetical protein Mapa_011140 [Marchantia paleacea]|nr:hypothetical protein Mapa_011140 [Marchantia paleacea]
MKCKIYYGSDEIICLLLQDYIKGDARKIFCRRCSDYKLQNIAMNQIPLYCAIHTIRSKLQSGKDKAAILVKLLSVDSMWVSSLL